MTFLPVVPTAAIEATIEALTFASVSDTPTAPRGLIIQLYDPPNGTGTGFLDVTVVPENEAPTGWVAISAEDGILHATTAGLTDPDGFGTIALRWQPRDGDWTELGATGPNLSILAGMTLRAVASYVDGGGTVEEVASAGVVRVGTARDDRLAAEGEGGDLVEDFTLGEDRIELRGSSFGGLAVGGLAAAQFAVGLPTITSQQPIQDPTDGALRFDPDGTGRKTGTLIAVLTGAPAIEAEDILVIA